MSELTTEGQRLSTKDPKASMIVEPAMMEAMAPLMEVALSTVKK